MREDTFLMREDSARLSAYRPLMRVLTIFTSVWRTDNTREAAAIFTKTPGMCNRWQGRSKAPWDGLRSDK